MQVYIYGHDNNIMIIPYVPYSSMCSWITCILVCRLSSVSSISHLVYKFSISHLYLMVFSACMDMEREPWDELTVVGW